MKCCLPLEHPASRNVVSGNNSRRIVVNIAVPTYGKTYCICIQPSASYESLCTIVKQRLKVLCFCFESEV